MHKTSTMIPFILRETLPSLIFTSTNKYARAIKIEVIQTTGSTNLDLRNRIKRLILPTALIAEKQTAGRGRAGRSWHSIPNSTLTFSLAWPFTHSIHTLNGLSLALGVSLVETLKAFGITSAVKWPNDILRNNAKLAGILIETVKNTVNNVTTTWGIIGIGLNLEISQNLKSRINYSIADAPELQILDRATLLTYLLRRLSNTLVKFELEGFSTSCIKRWNQFHAYNECTVCVFNNNRLICEGTAIGVNHLGYLLVNTKNGYIEIATGDVSLRLKHNTT